MAYYINEGGVQHAADSIEKSYTQNEPIDPIEVIHKRIRRKGKFLEELKKTKMWKSRSCTLSTEDLSLQNI